MRVLVVLLLADELLHQVARPVVGGEELLRLLLLLQVSVCAVGGGELLLLLLLLLVLLRLGALASLGLRPPAAAAHDGALEAQAQADGDAGVEGRRQRGLVAVKVELGQEAQAA